MRQNPIAAFVAFHREQPAGAFFGMLMFGIFASFASFWTHGWIEADTVKVSSALIVITGVLFAVWTGCMFATVISSLLMKRNKVLFVASFWFIVSMVQLGVTPHVANGTIAAVVIMAAVGLAGYLVATYRLAHEFAVRTKEAKIAALVGRQVAVKKEEEAHDGLIPRKVH